MLSPNATQDRPCSATHVVRRCLITAGGTLALVATLGVGSLQIVDANAASQAATTPAATATTVAAQQDTGIQALSVADVAEIANPAVVTVTTFTNGESAAGGFQPTRPLNPGSQPGSSDSDESTPIGAGSGWILDSEGHVVTNAHVVNGADSFIVQYQDGTQVAAMLVGIDEFQDVAVLQLELAEGETVPGVAQVGDSTAVRPGDQVVALGSPLGEFTNSVSDGIIGGLDRSLDTGNGLSLDNLIQHDAELSSGNSGGPLLNMQGEVIGMNVASVQTTGMGNVSATGLNFAIDGNTVATIADEIISTNTSIPYPYLGVGTGTTQEGQVIGTVEPGSPADTAGLEPGDIVIAMDGNTFTEDATFMDLLLEHRAGDMVTLTVSRDGAEQNLTVTLGARPDSLQAE